MKTMGDILKDALKNHVSRLQDCEDLCTWITNNTKVGESNTLQLIRNVTLAKIEAEEIMEEILREK